MRHMNFVDHGIQDLRFALRQLLKHRGFACTAIVVLALGIAGSVAIFGFVDAALIKPLPYRDSSRLVTVFAAPPIPRTVRSRARSLTWTLSIGGRATGRSTRSPHMTSVEVSR
jgi:hypothetical protein